VARRQAWTRGPLGDVALAGSVLAVVAVWGGSGLDTLGWVVAGCESAALCVRGRHPVAVAAFTLAACVVYYSLSEVHGPVFPAFLVALYTVAARARPEGAGPALDAIKASSKEALRELRATLGVLRQVDEQAPPGPADGLAGLAELVEWATAAGLRIDLRTEGSARDVPPEVGLAGYRIVQESLTNVTRHACASRAVVRVRFADHDVTVEVEDDGRGPGAASGGPGSGLRGMADRAGALGGEFAAGPSPGGGFGVSARLPTTPVASRS
jgi:hypothetical protein